MLDRTNNDGVETPMATWVPFNLNGYVRVRLTDAGREVMRMNRTVLNGVIVARGCQPLPDIPSVTEDADGWSKWQLWALMQEFGSDMYMGSCLMFETTMQFEDDRG